MKFHIPSRPWRAAPGAAPVYGEHEMLSVTVLGSSGDLARKKTYPALFALFMHSHLPRKTIILGYAR